MMVNHISRSIFLTVIIYVTMALAQTLFLFERHFSHSRCMVVTLLKVDFDLSRSQVCKMHLKLQIGGGGGGDVESCPM